MDRFKDIGEFGFIDRIAAHAQHNRVLCGIGDDCAVMAAGQGRVRLVTVDAMVEGVQLCAAGTARRRRVQIAGCEFVRCGRYGWETDGCGRVG